MNFSKYLKLIIVSILIWSFSSSAHSQTSFELGVGMLKMHHKEVLDFGKLNNNGESRSANIHLVMHRKLNNKASLGINIGYNRISLDPITLDERGSKSSVINRLDIGSTIQHKIIGPIHLNIGGFISFIPVMTDIFWMAPFKDKYYNIFHLGVDSGLAIEFYRNWFFKMYYLHFFRETNEVRANPSHGFGALVSYRFYKKGALQ